MWLRTTLEQQPARKYTSLNETEDKNENFKTLSSSHKPLCYTGRKTWNTSNLALRCTWRRTETTKTASECRGILRVTLRNHLRSRPPLHKTNIIVWITYIEWRKKWYSGYDAQQLPLGLRGRFCFGDDEWSGLVSPLVDLRRLPASSMGWSIRRRALMNQLLTWIRLRLVFDARVLFCSSVG